MRLRFSIRWLLAAMAYAAISAAAFSQSTWIYSDLLWAASFLAFGYAVVVAIVARGPRQARALGFVTLLGCMAACLKFARETLPIERWLLAATGDESFPDPYASAGPTISALRGIPGGAATTFTISPALPTARPSGWMVSPSPRRRITVGPIGKFAYQMRAANAASAMIAGLIGCVLGSLAFRRATPGSAERPAKSIPTSVESAVPTSDQ